MGRNKDWIKAVIAHQDTGAVPYNFLFCPTAAAALRAHYGTDDLAEAIDLPMRMTSCASIKPLYASPAEFGPSVTDEYGVTWSTTHIDRGSPTGPALREADLSGYSFPDPAAEYRFEGLGAWCRDNAEHFTVIWVGDLWERATFVRGMENVLLDVAADEGFVAELLRGIADYVLATAGILLDRYEFDAIAVSDDYGTQKALVISPEHWRRLIKPLLAEIYGLAKGRGRYVFHHTCGHVTPIIPDLIEVGLDILHPIQPETMDIHRLKREYGAELAFCGGLRTQDLLPAGAPGEVRAAVRELKRTMGPGGGYILEPGITVQDDVPLANMLVMIEEARRH